MKCVEKEEGDNDKEICSKDEAEEKELKTEDNNSKIKKISIYNDITSIKSFYVYLFL